MGDRLFNLVFASLLRSVRARLAALEVVVELPAVLREDALGASDENSGDTVQFTDVSYVDDSTFCI